MLRNLPAVSTATAYDREDGLNKSIECLWGLAGARHKRIARRPLTDVIGDRLDMTGTPQSRFYDFDAAGNTRALLDQYGSGLSRGAYAAWGSTYGYSPGTPFGWMGEWGCYTDSESGLVYMGARYYAPGLGRFISRDPAAFDFGLNGYAYRGDDPINFFDTTGCRCARHG